MVDLTDFDRGQDRRVLANRLEGSKMVRAFGCRFSADTTSWEVVSMVRSILVGLIFMAGSGFMAIARDTDPILGDLDPKHPQMREIIERYQVDHGSLERSITSGPSLAKVERLKAFSDAWLKALDAIEFDALDQAGKVDFVLLKTRIGHEAKTLENESAALHDTTSILPFAGEITALAEARRKLDPIDPKQAANRLFQLENAVKAAQKATEERQKGLDKVAKKTAMKAAREARELHETLSEWFEFYNGYDPLFTWWNAEPYKAANEALQAYSKYINESVAGINRADRDAIVGNPIGAEMLRTELDQALIPYSPEQLVVIANKEFAWCEAEMKKASAEMGFGDDWKKALETVKTLHVEPGKQPALIRDLALEAIDYVQKNDLVTVPPLALETWRMDMMTADLQKLNPFFTGGEVISVAFPTNTMSHEQKLMSLRGNNAHFARATVHHELIPGHHLQGYMSQRYKPYRRAFSTPFLVEGWALYWETLLWDRGFARSPEDRVGMLFWRMHRCARIIFSLEFHLGKMTPQQCVDFLVDRVGHERDNATAEVRRSFTGGYGPLYQAAYMLGGLQIRALRKELVETGKMTDRGFHDAILRENAIPIEMIRAGLTQQPLTKDYKTAWKFFGEIEVPAETSKDAEGWPVTRAERSDYRETSDGKDVNAFLETLKAKGAPIELSRLAKSAGGLEIPLAIVSAPKVTSGDDAHKAGKLVVYIQANIHGGEVEGKEAALILLRDLSRNPADPLLKSMVFVVVPNYNADGNDHFDGGGGLKKRPSQDGPKSIGDRTNANDLDLNRDCIKADSAEMQGVLAKVYDTWNPDIILDLHTTNGTRHGYGHTYAPPVNPNTEKSILEYSRDDLIIKVKKRLSDEKHLNVFDYGNLYGGGPKRGWYTFGDEGRYVSNYAGLRNRVGILSEAVSFLPFKTRIDSTLEFVKATLTELSRNAPRVLERIRQADAAAAMLGSTHQALGVRFAFDQRRGTEAVPIEDLNVGESAIHDKAPKRIKTEVVPVFDRFKATSERRMPSAYLLPPSEAKAAGLLRRHGIKVGRLKTPWKGEAESFAIVELETAKVPYQGHNLRRLEGVFETTEFEAPAGSFVVETSQPLAILAFGMLEPEGLDGLAAWGLLEDPCKPGGCFGIRKVFSKGPADVESLR